ncbi:MAG: hypothetical protein Q9227_008141 [Pyrenula ochraceoflavens]
MALMDPEKENERVDNALDAVAKETQPEPPKEEPLNLAKTRSEEQYPSLLIAAPSILSLYLCAFLVALDRTIIATAIPRITDDFHSLGDVGWKTVFLFALALFELGSIVSGAAPNSTAFILGRAIAGAGSAGIFSGAITIMIHLVPLQKRPLFAAMGGAVFGIASIAGPLLGGAFTNSVSWRWCFYINLPLGGLTSLVIIFIIKTSTKVSNAELSLREKLLRLDPLGCLCLLPGIVCLLLALQWGGSTYPWSNARIIALLVLFGLLSLGFIAVQILKPDTATVPPRIFKQRSIMAGFSYITMVGGSMMVIVYYIAIWFQAIKRASPIHSGIMTLPTLLAMVCGSFTAGPTISLFVGYYTPYMIASPVGMSIGLGLMTTFTPETGHAKWIGYQVIFGYFLGLGFQQANMAAQTVLPKIDVPSGTALMFFGQQLGGALFISVAQNIFSNRLISGLKGIGHINPAQVVNAGATDIRNVVKAGQLEQVLGAYNGALTDTFTLSLALACAAFVPALFMEWKSVRKEKRPKPKNPQADAKNDEKV